MTIHEYFLEQGSYLVGPDEWTECQPRRNEAGEVIEMTLAPAPLVPVPEPIVRSGVERDVTINLPEIKAAKNHNCYAVARHIGSDGETYYPATDGDGGAYWLWINPAKITPAIKIDLVVTRHDGLVEYLLQEGIIDSSTKVISHAQPEIIKGKNVLGVLPHSLSCLTLSFSEIPLDLTPADRGQELTCSRIREIAGEMVTYKVNVV